VKKTETKLKGSKRHSQINGNYHSI